MGRRVQARVKTLEKVSALWVIILTFCVGLAVVLPQYPAWMNSNLILLLYIFLEFLPLLLFVFTVIQPTLSPYLLLPWLCVNTCIILFSSILVLSLSIDTPTKRNVIFCLLLSTIIIFPIVTTVLMSLPALIFLRRRVPNYRRKIRKSSLYRTITKQKTAEEIEQEIIERRKEQVRNTIITDKSYEQFIYVNRAASKWKKKVEMKRMANNGVTNEKNMFAEGNVTVNVAFEMEETDAADSLQANSKDNLVNGVSTSDKGNRIENGKMVTDVWVNLPLWKKL